MTNTPGAWPAFAVAALLAGTAAAANASPLDQAACDKLRDELAAIERTGARINFSKGAAWAKANLGAGELQQVRKLIETEQQFLFRCPQPKRQFDPATEQILESGTGSDPDPNQPAAAPAAGAAPATKSPAPRKPRPPRAAAVEAAPAAAAATDPAPAPKPKRAAAPKPKPEDAFVPPAKPAAN